MINTNTVSTRREENSIISVRKMCVVALAIVLNVIGGQIALMLHLPIYLDSIGTIMIAMLYGPVYGMLPPLLYGLVMGFTLDIYSLYFMPVGLMHACRSDAGPRDRSCIEIFFPEKMENDPGRNADHHPRHHRERCHYSGAFRRNYFFGLHSDRAGTQQGRPWPYCQCFHRSDPHRLSGQTALTGRRLLSAARDPFRPVSDRELIEKRTDRKENWF